MLLTKTHTHTRTHLQWAFSSRHKIKCNQVEPQRPRWKTLPDGCHVNNKDVLIKEIFLRSANCYKLSKANVSAC